MQAQQRQLGGESGHPSLADERRRAQRTGQREVGGQCAGDARQLRHEGFEHVQLRQAEHDASAQRLLRTAERGAGIQRAGRQQSRVRAELSGLRADIGLHAQVAPSQWLRVNAGQAQLAAGRLQSRVAAQMQRGVETQRARAIERAGHTRAIGQGGECGEAGQRQGGEPVIERAAAVGGTAAAHAQARGVLAQAGIGQAEGAGAITPRGGCLQHPCDLLRGRQLQAAQLALPVACGFPAGAGVERELAGRAAGIDVQCQCVLVAGYTRVEPVELARTELQRARAELGRAVRRGEIAHLRAQRGAAKPQRGSAQLAGTEPRIEIERRPDAACADAAVQAAAGLRQEIGEAAHVDARRGGPAAAGIAQRAGARGQVQRALRQSPPVHAKVGAAAQRASTQGAVQVVQHQRADGPVRIEPTAAAQREIQIARPGRCQQRGVEVRRAGGDAPGMRRGQRHVAFHFEPAARLLQAQSVHGQRARVAVHGQRDLRALLAADIEAEIRLHAIDLRAALELRAAGAGQRLPEQRGRQLHAAPAQSQIGADGVRGERDMALRVEAAGHARRGQRELPELQGVARALHLERAQPQRPGIDIERAGQQRLHDIAVALQVQRQRARVARQQHGQREARCAQRAPPCIRRARGQLRVQRGGEGRGDARVQRRAVTIAARMQRQRQRLGLMRHAQARGQRAGPAAVEAELALQLQCQLRRVQIECAEGELAVRPRRVAQAERVHREHALLLAQDQRIAQRGFGDVDVQRRVQIQRRVAGRLRRGQGDAQAADVEPGDVQALAQQRQRRVVDARRGDAYFQSIRAAPAHAAQVQRSPQPPLRLPHAERAVRERARAHQREIKPALRAQQPGAGRYQQQQQHAQRAQQPAPAPWRRCLGSARGFGQHVHRGVLTNPARC